MSDKVREKKIDNIKGILILLTVFAHILISYRYVEIKLYSSIVKFIYTFHMPLFFIISGELSKNINYKRIIKYFLLFLLMHISFIIYDYYKTGFIDLFCISYSSWFILLIIIYRILISNKYFKLLVSNRILVKIIITFLLLLGFINFNSLLLSRIAYFFIFFILGFYCRNYHLNKKSKYFTLIVSLIGLFLLSTMTSINLFMGFSYVTILDFFIRTTLILLTFNLYHSLKSIMINKDIVLLTKFGYYALFIYLFHRIPTIIMSNYFYIYKSFIVIAFIFTILLCLGIIIISKYLNILIDSKLLKYVILILIIPVFVINITSNNEMSIQRHQELDDCISIGYVGDLILLEDQLNNSNNNFDYLFGNMTSYFNYTDYLIGVLAGPVDDNKELRLNYPTSFLNSISKAGFDLVSISNNHMLDREIISYKNTTNNLNKYNIKYVGEKNKHIIVNVKGLKIGVLAYTYDMNYEDDGYENITNYLINPWSKKYSKVKDSITKDFENLKKDKPDLIIVMPHYGTQFSNKIDVYQETYNRLFVSLGANIILGGHAHTIQPIEYYKDSIIINSPGNYINSYTKYNDDISMFVKIYIDKSKKIKGTSITPIIAQKNKDGLYYPTIMNNVNSHHKKAKELIGEVIFSHKIKETKTTYYYSKDEKYQYENKYHLNLLESDKKSKVYQEILQHNKICFIGDSITGGTRNNNHPWYEVLMSNFDDKEIINISKGSFTSDDIINEFKAKILKSHCEVSIINVGTNDIRYSKKKCG